MGRCKGRLIGMNCNRAGNMRFSWVILTLVLVSGCSFGLSEAETIWCGSHPVHVASSASFLEIREGNMAGWDQWVEANPDGYNRACKDAYDFAHGP